MPKPKSVGSNGKKKLPQEQVKKLAKRWMAGEELNDLAKECDVSWQTLAGYFVAGNYRASLRKKANRKPTDWKEAVLKAAKTHKWSITMTKWLISGVATKTKWHLLTFTGSAGQESKGVVDILAVRKNHRATDPVRPCGLNPGDLFDIILIQVKGGTAPRPKVEDIERLRLVSSLYQAKAVLLAEWKKGKRPTIFRLKPCDNDPKTAWEEQHNLLSIFEPQS